jgi:hypothetical protein
MNLPRERWAYAVADAKGEREWVVSYTHQTGDPPVHGDLMSMLYHLGSAGWEFVGRVPRAGSLGVREALVFKRRL